MLHKQHNIAIYIIIIKIYLFKLQCIVNDLHNQIQVITNRALPTVSFHSRVAVQQISCTNSYSTELRQMAIISYINKFLILML